MDEIKLCKFCGKECKNNNSLKNHEIRCKENKNRIPLKGNKSHNKRRPRKKQLFTCEYCGKIMETTKTAYLNHIRYNCYLNPNKLLRKRVGPTEEGKKRLSALAKQRGLGGYVPDARGGREKKGYYKGLYCMSSWELAFVVYHLDRGDKVEQVKEHFNYEMEGVVRKYTPDFKIDNVYYEIKGYHSKDVDFKINQFPKDKKLILIDGKEENKPFLDYAKEKYGSKFWEVLYEKNATFV